MPPPFDQPMDMDVGSESALRTDCNASAVGFATAPGPVEGPGASGTVGAGAFDVEDDATDLEVEDAGEEPCDSATAPSRSPLAAGAELEGALVAAPGLASPCLAAAAPGLAGPCPASVPGLCSATGLSLGVTRPLFSSSGVWRPDPDSSDSGLLSPLHPLVRVPGVTPPPEGFELLAYLSRLGLSPSETDAAVSRLAGSPELLCSLMRRHLSQIPFEAMDPLVHRAIDVSPRGIHDKIVAGGRGGWCFEQNALMAWALRGLGYRVDRLLGRVLVGEGGADGEHPRTHAVSLVHFEELGPEGEWGEGEGADDDAIDEPTNEGELAPQRLLIDGDDLTAAHRGDGIPSLAGASTSFSPGLRPAYVSPPALRSTGVLAGLDGPDGIVRAYDQSLPVVAGDLGKPATTTARTTVAALGSQGSTLAASASASGALPSCLPSPHLAFKGPLAEPFLVDVGFGGRGSTWPLPVARRGIFKTAHGTFRIRDPEREGQDSDAGADAQARSTAAPAELGKRSRSFGDERRPEQGAVPGSASSPAAKRARHLVVDLEREGLAGVLRLPLRVPTRGPLIVEKLVENDEDAENEAGRTPDNAHATDASESTATGLAGAETEGWGAGMPAAPGAGDASAGAPSPPSTPRASNLPPSSPSATIPANASSPSSPSLTSAAGLATPCKPPRKASWERQYELYLDPQRDSDFHTGNWYVSTHDSSVFRHRLFVSRVTDDERRILFDGGLTVEPSEAARARGKCTKRKWLDDPNDIEDELQGSFGLTVQDEWKQAIQQAAKRAREKKESGGQPSGE